MPRLADYQKEFTNTVLREDLSSIQLHLNACEKFPLDFRLEVYRNNVFASLKNVLREVFAKTRALMGEDYFTYLSHHFVKEHPPVDGCLSHYGGDFPDYIGASDQAKDYPFLKDIACLEWILSEAYYLEGGEPLDQVQLAFTPPDKMPALTFRLRPSVSLIKSNYPLKDLWGVANRVLEGIEEGEGELSSGPGYALVLGHDTGVDLFWLEPSTYAFLLAVQEGKPLEDAFEAAAQINEACDLQSILAFCFHNKLFLEPS